MTTRSNYRPWSPSYATASIPPSCSTAAALSSGYTCGPKSTSPAAPNPTCFPWGAPSALSSDYTFYSPATACPSGYNYEASRTRTTALAYPRTAAAQDQWIDGETAVYCCPDGYGWSDVAAHCRLRYGGVYLNANCSEGGDVSTMTLSEIGGSVRAVAPAVQVRFQMSDGKFEAPREMVAVTTPVGGGEGPAETEAPEGSDGGLLVTGGGEGGAESGGGGEATQSVVGTGGAGGAFRGGKIWMGMVAFLVAGMIVF